MQYVLREDQKGRKESEVTDAFGQGICSEGIILIDCVII